MVEAQGPVPNPETTFQDGSGKKCIFVFVRHGERLDRVDKIPAGQRIDFPYDPPLTDKGKNQAAQAGDLTKKFLEGKGYSDAPVKFISSPHLRTLQTTAFF